MNKLLPSPEKFKQSVIGGVNKVVFEIQNEIFNNLTGDLKEVYNHYVGNFLTPYLNIKYNVIGFSKISEYLRKLYLLRLVLFSDELKNYLNENFKKEISSNVLEIYLKKKDKVVAYEGNNQ